MGGTYVAIVEARSESPRRRGFDSQLGHVNTTDDEVLTRAYNLLGDGQGGEWDLNPEYTRAIAELTRDVLGLEDAGQTLEKIRAHGEPRSVRGAHVARMETYSVETYQDGKFWMVRIPDLVINDEPGLTQAESRTGVEIAAREFLALELDVPIDLVAVTVNEVAE